MKKIKVASLCYIVYTREVFNKLLHDNSQTLSLYKHVLVTLFRNFTKKIYIFVLIYEQNVLPFIMFYSLIEFFPYQYFEY